MNENLPLHFRLYVDITVTNVIKTCHEMELSNEARSFFESIFYMYVILPTIHKLYSTYTDTPKLSCKEE